MVTARQRGRITGLRPKQIEVLDFLGKVDDICDLITLQIAYHHWRLDTVTYYYDSNHGPVYAPLSYQRANAVTTP